ncbi:tetratricopeptide repeat protein [Spirochaetia bacterium 38H-sp]|uniref:Tetratricopeptide repeat protein n=1 Tax=Rarispira pelagica TaxID=3141764 RepID=A0ABU9U9X8_9SPIR
MPEKTAIQIDAQENKLRKAQDAYQLGDLTVAENITKSILKEMYKSPGAHILMGLIKLQKGETQKAIEYFDKSISLEPTSEAFNNLGVAYRKIGKYNEAIRAFTKALQDFPPRADIYYNLANTYKDIGKSDKAIEAYKIAIKINPNFTSAYNNLATLYQEAGKNKEAIETLEKGLEHDPDNTSLLYNMGITYQLQKRYQEARKYFLKTLQKKPKWIECINNLGIVEQALGLSNDAIERFKIILKENSSHAPAINNLASILARKGQYNEALRLFVKALKNNPQHQTAAHNIIHLLREHASFFDAEKELSILSVDFPENITIKLAYAKLLFDNKKYDKAEEILLELENAGAEDPEISKLLGIIAFIEKDEKRASKYFSVYKAEKKDTSYELEIIKLLREQKDYKNAILRLKEYLSDNPSDKEAKILYAEICLDQGNIDEAFSIMKKAEEENKDDPQILSTFARIYQKSGQKEKAIETIDNIISIQSKRGTEEDISNLNESLSLYEETIKAFMEGENKKWEENLKKISNFSSSEEEWEIDLSITEMDDGAKLLNFEERFTKEGSASLIEETEEEETEKEEDRELPTLEQQFIPAQSPSLLDLPDEALRRPQQPVYITAPPTPQQSAPQFPAPQQPQIPPVMPPPQQPYYPPPSQSTQYPPQPNLPQQAPPPIYPPQSQQPTPILQQQVPQYSSPQAAPPQYQSQQTFSPQPQSIAQQTTAPPQQPQYQTHPQPFPSYNPSHKDNTINQPSFQPEEDLLQPEEDLLQPEEDLLQPEEDLLQPEEDLTENLTQDNATADLAEEPLAEEPLAEEPLAEEPLAEEPLAEEPLAEESFTQPQLPQNHPNIPLEHMPEYADLGEPPQPAIPMEELPEYADLHDTPRAEVTEPEEHEKQQDNPPVTTAHNLPSPQEQAALLNYLENLASYLPEPRKQELEKSNYKTKLDRIKERLLRVSDNKTESSTTATRQNNTVPNIKSKKDSPSPPSSIQEMGERMEKLLTAINDFRSKST